MADVAPEVLAALESGAIATANLPEGLAIDQSRLVRAVWPQLAPAVLAQIDLACELGILKRMGRIGQILWGQFGADGMHFCQQHVSDTVRGWACFMVAEQPGLSLPQRLENIRPLASDSHFGVREWAWLAVRPHLAADIHQSLELLQDWTRSPLPELRRFACESIRPRGVWCAHISVLKSTPQLALPLLQALRADTSVYVQDSVANWLNDAGKTQPDWVRDVCRQWQQDSDVEATHRICRRAQRSLK